ncbi:MAG: photosynthetic reaction center cytochrome c subunit [Betaproteobacteria bacterium]|nr:photosynthetic reaction center cytochrome c subunit [Betaproteobacteria bacterium]
MSAFAKSIRLLALPLAALLLAGCERPPIVTVQTGYRGTGMEQIYNPRTLATQASLNAAPAAQPAAASDGPKAKEIYQNVQVLGDLSVAEFTRHMTAITQWVAPTQGCGYCHNLQNLADDSKYTKVVARRMIQMTQHVNADWKKHVGDTGVTCYTCHRGNPVPAQVWFAPKDRRHENSLMGDLAGQNIAAPSVALSSLPFDPFTPYLKDDKPIRVNGDQALRFTGAAFNRNTTKQTEHTYALMVHMSESLGVNCTYCHNTRSFQSWSEAPPQRVTAWHGIRMARDLNNAYMEPLTKTFPAERLGPKGDVAKVACGTCHQGAYKPLYGAKMAKDHPELLAVSGAAAAAAPAAADAAAPAASEAAPAATPAAAGAAPAAPAADAKK